MYMITYKVAKEEGLEGTYGDLSEAQAKLKKLQEKYVYTKFEIREVKNNNLYKYMKGEELHNE